MRFTTSGILLALAACTAPQPRGGWARAHAPAGVSLDGQDEPVDEPELRLGPRARWIPLAVVEADVDEDERGRGILFEPDLDTGHGWAIGGQAALGDSLVLLSEYARTVHADRRTDAEVEIHNVMGAVAMHSRLIDTRAIDVGARLGAGIGIVVFDFDRRYDDTGGGTLSGLGDVVVTLFDRFELDLGLRGFLWGYPGETVGYGAMFTIGGGVSF